MACAAICLLLLGAPVLAQTAAPAASAPTPSTPPTTPASTPAPPRADPPARVGRVARINGIVTLHDPGEERWRVARVNLPLSAGQSVWVERGGTAALDISASRIGLDGGTELRIDGLDDQSWQATLARGEAHLRLLNVPVEGSVRIATPRGVVVLGGDGSYLIAAGAAADSARPTIVTVLEGSARLELEGASTALAANQAATVDGTGPQRVSVGPARVDSFAVAMMAQEPRFPAATPDIVRQMSGSGDLAAYGNWQATSAQGAVWFPRVETGWAPYRTGVWAWVEPWGWTWVDDSPWGFAPFHFGRWMEIDGRWAWVPAALNAGPGFRPAYAPALVGFVGIRRPVGQPAEPARAAMSVLGWVPLAPGEAYQPGFAASREFVQRLNLNHVRGASALGDGAVPPPSVNREAVTLVPAGAMLASRPVQWARMRLPPEPAQNLEVVQGTDLPRPIAASLGMTPQLAQRLGVLPRGTGRPALYSFPTLRPAGSGSMRLPGAAPGPEITAPFPGLRNAPGPLGYSPAAPRR